MVTQVFEQAKFCRNDGARGEDDRDEDTDDDRPHPVFTDEDTFERGAALEGLKLRVSSRQFRSARITAVLSGVTLDLRDAVLCPDGATIHVQAAASGIDILVPRDWEVTCDMNAICGGVDPGRRPQGGPARGPKLRVTGTVVVGGLCVR
jgi:predicted membrane protein